MTQSDTFASRDELVTVAAVRTELEAQLIVATLADEGIDAVAFPIGAGVLPMATPARPNANLVPIQVRAEDAERAQTVIAARRAAASANAADAEDRIDWDEIDVGERVDGVPLGTPGRMPISIRIIALLAIVLLGGSCLIGTALTIFRDPAEVEEPVGP